LSQHSWKDRTIALAAMFHFATMVKRLATTGHISQNDMKTAIVSLFQQNPNHIDDVYGSIQSLESGCQLLSQVMKRQNTSDGNDIVRYVMGIIHLQKKLLKRPDMLDIISNRLKQSQQQAEVFDITHDNVVAGLADIYTSTLSTFSFRIQVTGDFNYLQQARIGNQIRVLLFAGIRAAVLWRQLGGNRLQVIIKRKTIVQTCDELLRLAKQPLH
jgi:high frequency lysogenization protein